VICAGWSAAFGSTGRPRASSSVATAITAARGHGMVRQERVDFIFGLPGNTVLDRLVDEAADDCPASAPYETDLLS
jgi:hypothetical protein